MRFGECKHFTGLLRDTCNAGVNYEDVQVNSTSLCCLGAVPCVCDRYQEPTQAEIDADKQDEDRMIADMLAQFAKLQPTLDKIKRKYKGNDMQGHMNCPICSGSKSANGENESRAPTRLGMDL